MRKFLVTILAILGGLLVLVVIVAVAAGLIYWGVQTQVPAKTVLEVDFQQGLTEYVPEEPLAKVMMEKTPVILDVVEALEKASDDKNVAGLVARVGAASMGPAEIQEMRDAVIAFRAKGKFATAFSDTLGEWGPGTGAYYLATAFDDIYLQPSGDVGLTGMIIESPFIRGTLDKLGIVPRMDHRYEYKTAMNMFTEKKFTDANREEDQQVMDSIFGQVVKGIAEARKLTEDQVRALVDKGPYYGQEAVDAKLVDGLAYRDAVYDKAKEKAGSGAETLRLSAYLDKVGRPYNKGTTIALIYGVGSIERGKSKFDPLFGGFSMGSDTTSAAFRAAIEDKDVKAILFRVNSPGGSYVASDTIWEETERARKAGKPVVVSMGYVAGSGGYFVSMAADKIVAQPGTITASIGVLSGKMLTTGFWDKLGVTWDEVHTSTNSTIWTGLQDYTPEQWQRFEDSLDRVYKDFTTKVAEGRKMPLEKVLEVAKGRIWTGEDAKRLGLVDELGGFPTALRLVREAAGLAPDAPINLKIFPKKKSLFELILQKESDGTGEGAAAASLVRILEAVQPAARLMRELGILEKPGLLTMPEPGRAR
jgi:protease-4